MAMSQSATSPEAWLAAAAIGAGGSTLLRRGGGPGPGKHADRLLSRSGCDSSSARSRAASTRRIRPAKTTVEAPQRPAPSGQDSTASHKAMQRIYTSRWSEMRRSVGSTCTVTSSAASGPSPGTSQCTQFNSVALGALGGEPDPVLHLGRPQVVPAALVGDEHLGGANHHHLGAGVGRHETGDRPDGARRVDRGDRVALDHPGHPHTAHAGVVVDAVLVDAVLMGVTITRSAGAAFPGEPVPGPATAWYAFVRAHRARQGRHPVRVFRPLVARSRGRGDSSHLHPTRPSPP
jgi:hypothetical protein